MKRKRMLVRGAMGGGAVVPYYQQVKNTFGSAIASYLPLDDLSGVTANDLSGNGWTGTYRNTAGTLSGVTLGQPGIGDGKTSVLLDGAAGFINWYLAGKVGLFNGAEGTFATWLKMANVGVWTDATDRRVVMLKADGSNLVNLQTPGTSRVVGQYTAGGTSKSNQNLSLSTTDWYHLAITWSKSGDAVITYYNGVQYGSTLTGLGVWAGALAAGSTILGAFSTGGSALFSGYMAHALILNRAATAAEVLSLTSPFLTNAPMDLSLFGAHSVEEGGAYTTFDNTNAFVDALKKTNHVTITTPGTYLLGDSIKLADNKTIEGVAGVTLKKKQGFAHTIRNLWCDGSGINRNIVIKNITIDEDNKTNSAGAVGTGHGVINFHFVDGLTMENVSVLNGANIFNGHFQEVQNAVITNYVATGRCGLQMQGGCRNILIDGFDVTSTDDAFAINAEDYPANSYSARDCENIIIRNGESKTVADQMGYFLRFETGSWADWTSGNTYNIGNLCVNDGKVYKMQNAGPTAGANAPVHTSGIVTGADGIQWRFMYSGGAVFYTSNIRHVTVHNVTLSDGRIITRYMSNDAWDKSEYPGTENTSILDDFHTSLSAALFVNTGLLGTTYFDETP